VVVTNVNRNASPDELRAAALCHIKVNGGGYVAATHHPEPVNEFYNPKLFPMMYPTLFPFGIRGFENGNQECTVSLRRHVKHLFQLGDRHFQEHPSFLFTAFNILQRRAILLNTHLKTQKNNFQSLAKQFAYVTPHVLKTVTARISQGDTTTSFSPEECVTLDLMKEVNLITANVPGSSAARVAM
jgi:hypothetical protein